MEDPATPGAWLILGLLLLASFVAFALVRAQQRRLGRGHPGTLPVGYEDDLDRLGLSEVRPRATPRSVTYPTEGDSAAPPQAMTAAPTFPEPLEEAAMDDFDPDDLDDLDFDDTGVSQARPRPEPSASPPAPTVPEAAVAVASPRHHIAPRSPLWEDAEPEAVAALLTSLGAAIGAQGVALLRYDDHADAYAVDVLAGEIPSARTAPIPGADSALHQVPDDRSISLLEGDALVALHYHADPVRTVGHAAALAVDGPPERVLLIADGAAGTPSFGTRLLALLGAYADLLGHLLAPPDAQEVPADSDEAAPARHGAEERPPEPEGIGPGARRPDDPEPDDDAPAAPVRRRADIIAEEMAAARVSEQPLALALVVLRDAEPIGGRGPTVVAEAEEALFERLRRVEGSTRVEHFGELMAGVFCHAGPTFVEAWAERVAAAGPPVHIGVALLRARHLDAEAFRADAATALHAAYEQGRDCVIME